MSGEIIEDRSGIWLAVVTLQADAPFPDNSTLISGDKTYGAKFTIWVLPCCGFLVETAKTMTVYAHGVSKKKGYRTKKHVITCSLWYAKVCLG